MWVRAVKVEDWEGNAVEREADGYVTCLLQGSVQEPLEVSKRDFGEEEHVEATTRVEYVESADSDHNSAMHSHPTAVAQSGECGGHKQHGSI